MRTDNMTETNTNDGFSDQDPDEALMVDALYVDPGEILPMDFFVFESRDGMTPAFEEFELELDEGPSADGWYWTWVDCAYAECRGPFDTMEAAQADLESWRVEARVHVYPIG
jgi:hypothetical protein